jgi:chloride channel protein, CIC family
VFQMPALHQPSLASLGVYLILGAIIGVGSVLVTRLVYWIEDLFARTHLHWMWWPALGAVVVGVVGYFAPKTLGVGYENISDVLTSRLTVAAAATLCLMKLASWSVALGSGTSGGTLAPLFTIGGAAGLVLGVAAGRLLPMAGVDPAIAALVGMAAMFAGASRAMLASIVFAFETTLQPFGLMPLLGGCTASCLVSSLLMRTTIMTEKIHRRGVRVPTEYVADVLAHIAVRDIATVQPTVLDASDTVAAVRQHLSSGLPAWAHQGFPVLDANKVLLGVLTRRDFADAALDPSRPIGELIHRPPVIVYDDLSLREAADHMLNHDVGQLPVISRRHAGRLVGILTLSDLLKAHRRRLQDLTRSGSWLPWPGGHPPQQRTIDAKSA